MFDWRHFLAMALILVVGYWAGTRYPGLLTKASMGTVTG